MIKTQVLVVGLGPAGASAAKEASAAGVKVVGIDRAKKIGYPVQCAEFIPLPMGSYAKQEGVLHQRIAGMKTYLPSGDSVCTDFPGYMIDREAFDQKIVDQAKNNGACIFNKTQLIDLEIERNKATVRSGDEELHIEYELLIAADGPHSKVASILGFPPQKIVQTRQYTVPLKEGYYKTDIWLSDYYPGGYAWLFPKGKLANLGLGADREYEDNLKKPLDALHKKLIDAGVVGEKILARTGGAIPVGGIREKLVYSRILFIGDAAGLTHPITGGGIFPAVVSGELAGKYAAKYLTGDAEAILDFEEDVRDQFEVTIRRAIDKRNYLNSIWKTSAAMEDAVMRQGWIAFHEYYQ